MRIALVGNQNSGKTSLFNVLTGSNQKIGNWPGVTIEKKVGKIKNTNHELIDLPGIYSLSPYTDEERISREFILNENVDLIINIVDATSIERSLYLTTQLLELDIKTILVLNMSDLLEKKGLQIDERKLSEVLKLPVVKVSALKRTGLNDLVKVINSSFKKETVSFYDEYLENKLLVLDANSTHFNKRFINAKLIEKDFDFEKYNHNNSLIKSTIEDIENHYNMSVEEVVASQRYDFIDSFKESVVIKKEEKKSISEKIDKIMLNKWLAIPIFASIMALIYLLAVGVVGSATVDFIDETVSNFSEWVAGLLEKTNASDWSISLVCNGIISGVGSVLNFVPQLIILFICISILETTGYMSRISFFFDRLFKKIGLSGKSLIPFIVGSGCSVPAIMSTRTIEDEKEKRATIMLTPFIPCSAKLPIISLFAGVLFKNSWLITFSLYIFAIVVIIISSLIIRKIFLKGETATYISELPEYKLPSFRYVFKDVFDKTIAFIKRAGTIILLCSVVIWFLLSFNFKFEYGIDIEESMLASIGKCFSWLFYPIVGKNSWPVAVSAIQGLVAKEQVVSSMAVIAGLSEDALEADILSSAAFSFFTPASAYAYMVFNLFSAPCFGAIGAMHRELGSHKKTLITILFQTGMAWLLACLVFLVLSILL